MCLAAMMVAGTSAKAQVTITLKSGWTWIGSPIAEEVDLATVFGSFTPQNGDIIKTQGGTSYYLGGYGWFGGITKLQPGIGYKYYSTRTEPVTVTFSGGYAYVDLGLPSGLLWATCNLGAESPEDYGDYFAWGETLPKDTYNWGFYQYCSGSSNTFIKYCNNSSYGYNGFTDTLTVLLPNNDAATVNWGNGWRMPTKAEWEELKNNTTVTWTTQNGVNGRLFTASNGNSLFLPAAGYRQSSSLYDAGNCAYYWSSSLSMDYSESAGILFCSSSYYGLSSGGRYNGFLVRPVCSSRQN